mgnify:FL=1
MEHELALNRLPFFKALVLPSEDGWQIRTLLSKHYNFSTGLIRQIKNHGVLLINNNASSMVAKVKPWDHIAIFLSYECKTNPELLPLTVIYEDDDLLIVNKEAGQIVHPRHQYISGTLANAIAGYLEKKGEQPASYLINRLDRGTSGLLLAAKNPLAAWILSNEINYMEKEYLALVAGVLERESGSIDLPIKDPENGMKRLISSVGKPARTDYYLLQQYKEAALLKISLKTGRTHQIRVHLSAIGHPIIGDDLYGEGNPFVQRPMLHAHFISFWHPRTGQICQGQAELPADFSQVIKMYQR